MVTVVVAALLVVLVLARPAGRGALAALAGQVARWPGMIRAEMRGAAPLGVDGSDGPVDGTDPRRRPGDTTPDIPVVTRGFPVVQRPDRG
jgi:hypothetical protein